MTFSYRWLCSAPRCRSPSSCRLTAAGLNRITLHELSTDLDVSGRAAQFGRGILGDVASSVLGEFATQLEQMVEGTGAPAPGADAQPAPTASAALDVRRVVIVPMLRRAAVPAACLLAGGVGGWLLARATKPARRRLPRVVIQT